MPKRDFARSCGVEQHSPAEKQVPISKTIRQSWVKMVTHALASSETEVRKGTSSHMRGVSGHRSCTKKPRPLVEASNRIRTQKIPHIMRAHYYIRISLRGEVTDYSPSKSLYREVI